jgi:hypothetical protein
MTSQYLATEVLNRFAASELQENANTRAGDAGLGSPLVCWRPYRDDWRCHPHDRPTLDPLGLGIYLAS